MVEFMVIRRAGRPVTADGSPAKDRILAAVRDLMQGGREFNRTDIAASAGVTPALITYHFPTRWMMMQAAIKPEIDRGIQQLKEVYRSSDPPSARLRALVGLFIRFNTLCGNALERYIEELLRENRVNEVDQLKAVRSELTAFVGLLLEQSGHRAEDARLAQQALWGMCRHISRSEPAFDGPDETEDPEVRLARQTDFVVALFTQHLAARPATIAPGDRESRAG